MPKKQRTNQIIKKKPAVSMVVMGHVMGPFGIQGWIKVHPYTEYIDGLLEYSVWWLGKGDGKWQKTEVESAHINGNTLKIKLKEYSDRTLAADLKGMQIAIPRDQLPKLPENGEAGYYWYDLIGTEVVNLQGDRLGKVTGLLETGAQDVLQVQGTDAEGNIKGKEILIPFIDQIFIKKVDLKFCQITVDWETDY